MAVQWWSVVLGFAAGWLATGVVALAFLAAVGSSRNEERRLRTKAADASADGAATAPVMVSFQPRGTVRRVRRSAATGGRGAAQAPLTAGRR
jgi:hypothetical protein